MDIRIWMVSPFFVLRSQVMSGVRWSISRFAASASGRRDESSRAMRERILMAVVYECVVLFEVSICTATSKSLCIGFSGDRDVVRCS
jgi:hypothetical protein